MQVICTNYISSVYSTHSFHILTSTVFPSFLCMLLNVTSTKWSPLYPPFLRFFFPYPFTFPSVFNSPAHIMQHLILSHFFCPHRASPVAAFFFHSLTTPKLSALLPLPSTPCLSKPTYHLQQRPCVRDVTRKKSAAVQTLNSKMIKLSGENRGMGKANSA